MEKGRFVAASHRLWASASVPALAYDQEMTAFTTNSERQFGNEPSPFAI